MSGFSPRLEAEQNNGTYETAHLHLQHKSGVAPGERLVAWPSHCGCGSTAQPGPIATSDPYWPTTCQAWPFTWKTKSWTCKSLPVRWATYIQWPDFRLVGCRLISLNLNLGPQQTTFHSNNSRKHHRQNVYSTSELQPRMWPHKELMYSLGMAKTHIQERRCHLTVKKC